jgi:hypothetical protein
MIQQGTNSNQAKACIKRPIYNAHGTTATTYQLYSEERIRSWHGRHNLSPHAREGPSHQGGFQVPSVVDGIGRASRSLRSPQFKYSAG